jgi:hypothetical protein
MKPFVKLRCLTAFVCVAVLAGSTWAQRPHANAASLKSAAGTYDISKEVSLEGKVLKFAENSPTPPIGAHVWLETASGNVDVHIGDVRLLHNLKLNIAAGTSVRFVGQTRTVGQSTVFLARLVQVGAQVVAVRSEHGMPVSPASTRVGRKSAGSAQANQPGGAR